LPMTARLSFCDEGESPPNVLAYLSSAVPKLVLLARPWVRPRSRLKSASLRRAGWHSSVPRLLGGSLRPNLTRVKYWLLGVARDVLAGVDLGAGAVVLMCG